MIADHHIRTCPRLYAAGRLREHVERAACLGTSRTGPADHPPFVGGGREPR